MDNESHSFYVAVKGGINTDVIIILVSKCLWLDHVVEVKDRQTDYLVSSEKPQKQKKTQPRTTK